MPSVRRLTAILAADVAGYSRLMGADEEGTHERLKEHRALSAQHISSPQYLSRYSGSLPLALESRCTHRTSPDVM
jgi:hypothetical protein